MNFSRTLALTKTSGILHRGLLNKKLVGLALKLQSRQSSGATFSYRKAPKINPGTERYAKMLTGMMWWWILWHCFTEYDELIGYYVPDPSKWTDEELGIPKD